MKHTCPSIQINPPKKVCWGDIIGDINNQQDLINKITQMMDARDEINFNTDNPVGTIVISETARTFRFGTWELLEDGKYLCATQDENKAGTSTEAGLPDIIGTIKPILLRGPRRDTTAKNAFKSSIISSNSYGGNYSGNGTSVESFSFKASDSNSIYGKSDTVTPYSHNVYIYKRIA